MLRTPLLFLALATATLLSAQTKDPLGLLTGGKSQQWLVGRSAAGAGCKAGDARYTFKAKPAVVVTAKCVNGVWKSSTQKITKWSANGKSGITFGKVRYEVKTMPASEAVCKGRAHCVCLVTVPDEKATATRTIYLTH